MSDPFRTPGMGSSPLLAHLAEVGDGRRRELPRDAAALPPDQRETRLDRVFGVDGNNAAGSFIAALLTWCAMVPIFGGAAVAAGTAGPALVGAAIAVGITVWAVQADRRARRERGAAVAARLAWAARLPFPVDGYDLWCLSEQPIFDVTLRVPVEPRQLVGAVAAVDPRAALSWLDERTARITIPPRSLTFAEQEAPYADPEGFARLVERLFVPLHADVPIERIAMGGTMQRRQ